MAAYGLYTHIQTNRRRSTLLLIGLFFLVYVMVFAGALVAEGLTHGNAPVDFLLQAAIHDLVVAVPVATVGAAIWIAIAWKFHQAMIDAITGATGVTRADEPRLYNLLENLCVSRGIPMPKLKIAEEAPLNAFATGLNQKQYSITVTRGLMTALDDAELEAVLGHELTHIRNGDVRMMVIAVIIAGVIGFVAELVFHLLFRGGLRFSGGRSSSNERKGGGGAVIIIAMVLIAIAWLLSVVIRFSLSRKREFLADAGAVELTKNADAMITALRKIEGRGELLGATSAVMEMCIDNPRSGFADLFATHPSVDARVTALVQYAGGHDPGPLALPPPAESSDEEGGQYSPDDPGPPPDGPWGHSPGTAPDGPATGPWGSAEPQGRQLKGDKPFLPGLPPRPGGPWGPKRG